MTCNEMHNKHDSYQDSVITDTKSPSILWSAEEGIRALDQNEHLNSAEWWKRQA